MGGKATVRVKRHTLRPVHKLSNITFFFVSAQRRGQYRIYDAIDSTSITHPIQPIPSQRTKGIFIFSTLYNQLVVGKFLRIRLSWFQGKALTYFRFLFRRTYRFRSIFTDRSIRRPWRRQGAWWNYSTRHSRHRRQESIRRRLCRHTPRHRPTRLSNPLVSRQELGCSGRNPIHWSHGQFRNR